MLTVENVDLYYGDAQALAGVSLRVKVHPVNELKFTSGEGEKYSVPDPVASPMSNSVSCRVRLTPPGSTRAALKLVPPLLA